MHYTILHTCNTLHEDTITITRKLIGGFLHTRSVYIINRPNFSHRASEISELHASLKLDHSLSNDAEDRKIKTVNYVLCKSA
jgi:hypothetical protein